MINFSYWKKKEKEKISKKKKETVCTSNVLYFRVHS